MEDMITTFIIHRRCYISRQSTFRHHSHNHHFNYTSLAFFQFAARTHLFPFKATATYHLDINQPDFLCTRVDLGPLFDRRGPAGVACAGASLESPGALRV